jgi:hypothetical protein
MGATAPILFYCHPTQLHQSGAYGRIYRIVNCTPSRLMALNQAPLLGIAIA